MGGTDDPGNIILVTPGEHANEHRILYEKYGKIEDYLAWKGLSGLIGKEEIIMTLMQENGKKVGKNAVDKKLGIFNPEVQKSEKYKEGMKEGGKITGRKMADSGHCKNVAPLGGGKNIGKKYWYNSRTGKGTCSFNKPGDDWIEGRNMDTINVKYLRENADNVKGSFWIKNENTGETRMVKKDEDVPDGFEKGRTFKTENIIDLNNTPNFFEIDGISQVEINYSFIIFNPSNLRWELIPKKNSGRIIKVSHSDYYGLIWLRDIIIEKYSLKAKKSQFNFNTEEDLGECILKLKEWREHIKIEKILKTKKLKKWKREEYKKKMEFLNVRYSFIESIRNKIIPTLYVPK